MLNTPYAETQIRNGAEVFGADGEKVGNISAVYPAYIVVAKGWFFPTDYYIPWSAIASADTDRVYLTLSRDATLSRGWDVRPTDLETATATAATMDAYGDYGDRDLLTDADRLAASRVATDTGDEIRIPVIEEELTATVRPQEAGAVRIEKDVVTEERVLDVPVTEERVRVERRAVDRAATAADLDSFEDRIIEVPLRTEAADVQKQARVKEEVVISKEAVRRTERVADTVRREEVFIDDATAGSAVFEGREDRTSPS